MKEHFKSRSFQIIINNEINKKSRKITAIQWNHFLGKRDFLINTMIYNVIHRRITSWLSRKYCASPFLEKNGII